MVSQHREQEVPQDDFFRLVQLLIETWRLQLKFIDTQHSFLCANYYFYSVFIKAAIFSKLEKSALYHGKPTRLAPRAVKTYSSFM